MVQRTGRRGSFWACSGYPKCKNALLMDARGNPIRPVDTGIACEKCNRPMAIRKGPRGPFLACTGYPGCRNAKPLPPELKERADVKAVLESWAAKKVLGSADHGRELTWEEFARTPSQEGYRYELVDGRLYVAPTPELPHDWVAEWIGRAIQRYSGACPSVINYVSRNAGVFVPNRPGLTCLVPDLAAYRDFPHHVPYWQLDWHQVSPILVVEALSPDNPEKDLERNVPLYRQVPSIQEYWILDALGPTLTLTAYRRRGLRWQKLVTIPQDGTYSTPLLPGYTLRINAQP
jgi:Uma2 family endonuclease